MTVQERLQKLEQELANLREMVKAMTKSNAQGESEVRTQISANKFTVTDENGKTRAILGVSPDSDLGGNCVSGLTLFNECGMPRVELYQDKEGGGLNLIGWADARFTVNRDHAELNMQHTNPDYRIDLTASNDGISLCLWSKGVLRATLTLIDKNVALCVLDEKGKSRYSTL